MACKASANPYIISMRLKFKNLAIATILGLVMCVTMISTSGCRGGGVMIFPEEQIKQPGGAMDVSISRWNGIRFLHLPILHNGYYQWQRIKGFVGEGLEDLYLDFGNFALGMSWTLEGYEDFTVAMLLGEIFPMQNFDTSRELRRITGFVYELLDGTRITVPYYVNLHLMGEDLTPGSGRTSDGTEGVMATFYFNSLRSVICAYQSDEFTVNLPFVLGLFHWFTDGIIIRGLRFSHGNLAVSGSPTFDGEATASFKVEALLEGSSIITDVLIIDFSFIETPEVTHSVYGSAIIFAI